MKGRLRTALQKQTIALGMPSEDDKWLKEFLERLSSQIESYSGENMIRESE